MKEHLYTAVFLMGLSISVQAAVTSEEAKRLGSDLTPLGALKAGNDDGSIPPWEGGLKNSPKNYVENKHMVNPFSEDLPLREITASNYKEHEKYLSEGQKALLTSYPDTYKIRVLPTRRTAHVPISVQEKSIANATTSQLINEGNSVVNYDSYYPFPIPENAYEVLWNHLLRYRGGSLFREQDQLVVESNGAFRPVRIEETAVFPENLVGYDFEKDSNTMIYVKQRIKAPARLTGTILLVHETKDQVIQPRKSWVYNSGQRRVRRAPQVGYDSPGTASDGLRTTDQVDMYSGAPDRYEWSLEGKHELFVPYNNYQLSDPNIKYKDLVLKNHLNPDFLRYEKHRVWKVVGKLKEGTRHIYSKRVMYIDEDTWQILSVDHYDNKGNLWKVSEGFHVQYYYAETPWLAGEAVYDLTNKRYIVTGLQNEVAAPIKFGFKMNKGEFTPAAIRRLGK